MRFRTGIALLTAAAAWGALGLQLWLIIGKMGADGFGAGTAVWRFLGFFTILTNGAVAAVASAIVLRPGSGMASARVRMAVVTAVTLVGIVYSLALRAIWEPTGWQAVADHALHDVTPPLFILTWFVHGHSGLAWRDAAWGVAGPVVYCLYALIRGSIDGWYAYWFLDPRKLSVGALAGNMVLLLLAFLAVALAFVAIDRWLGRQGARSGRGA